MEQRVRKVVQAIDANDTDEITKYIYAGSQLLFTTDNNNDKLTEHILTPNGQIIASQRFDGTYEGNYYFYNTDARNSTMSILDDSYTAVKYYEYNEYGKQEEKGNADFINDNTYTGAVSEGGNIFYMNARFYDANNGRFLTQDTYKGNAWEPWSQNLYTYVGNNPINYVDPTGHKRKEAYFFRNYLPRITDDGLIEKPKYSWRDQTDEELTSRLLSAYAYYESEYETGTYYEDVNWSVVYFGGAEMGKTVVVNLDEGWIALYEHAGLEVGLGLLPIDAKISAGEVFGVATPEDYEGGFWQSTGTALIQGEGATNSGKKYGEVTQNGSGFMTNISISGGWSYYDCIKALEVSVERNVTVNGEDNCTIISYHDYFWKPTYDWNS